MCGSIVLAFAVLFTAGPLHAAAGREFSIHNPHNAPVHTVHLVQSAHFDGGCKTGGCSAKLVAGEPNRCMGNKIEPYAYHILNRWFDEFLLTGVALANQSKGTGSPYKHLVQPWIVSLFFDCANAGLLSWPGSGWDVTGTPVLHCPNASTVEEVRAAFQRGDLLLHAFPHNGEPDAFPDASLFESALSMAKTLSKDVLGIAPPTAVSQRDVPGWPRATIPLLVKHGVNGISIGAGQPPGKPDTPPLFVWQDEGSNTNVVVTYESAYGSASNSTRSKAVVFVLPNGVAMAAGWRGDNQGPPPMTEAMEDYGSLRTLFPNATVQSSSFDAFFNEANKPEVKALLPVVTQDIGDAWVYGVPSDPLKNTLFREAARQRSACIGAGQCDPNSPAMRAFDRLLMKVPEHTWGVAMQIFLPDYTNWTNAQFDAARDAQQPTGFLNTTSSAEADYSTTINSWREQRLFVTDAPKVVAAEHQELAASLDAAFRELQNVTAPSVAGFSPVAGATTETFVCGGVTVGFDDRGALSTLETLDSSREVSTSWASSKTPVGLYQYHTFDNDDYNLFIQDFASRVDGPGCGGYTPGSDDDGNCKNFRKPNVSSASPKRRIVFPSLVKLWHRTTSPSPTGSSSSSSSSNAVNGGSMRPQETTDGNSCEFVAEMSLDPEAHALAGAPERLAYTVQVSAAGVSWDVVQLNKRPTRLPEAGFFSFNLLPAAAAAAAAAAAQTSPLPMHKDKDEIPSGATRGDADVSDGSGGWRLQTLGSTGIAPTDVLGSGSGGSNYNTSTYGGSPHLRSAEAITWMKPGSRPNAPERGNVQHDTGDGIAGSIAGVNITSLDVPIICTGVATPFPSPRTGPPDMSQGVHFNIFNNIWNTNYVLFYPFDSADANILSRFNLAFF